MIVYVKINKTYVEGVTSIEASYKSWELGRLLDDPEFRNQKKYLIAIFNKQIVEAFCIKAVAQEKKSIGRKRRVLFALQEVTPDCKEKIINACTKSLSKINTAQASNGYIDTYLDVTCDCAVDEIPILEDEFIVNGRILKATSMDLKFIWVNEYRAIKKLGYNFNHSGKHQFKYEDEKIVLTPSEVSKLDFGSKITGVTAIAGENGSGKSSLCEIALLTTATRINGSLGWNIDFDGIVCYGNYFFYHESRVINNLNLLEDNGYIIIKFKDTPFENIEFEDRLSFSEGGFVYYSNVLDLRSDFDAMNLANISSQNLLAEDYKYSTSYPESNPYSFEPSDEYKYMDQKNPIQIYSLGQGYRSTKFYIQFPSFIPFQHPKYIVLISTYTGNNRWLRLDLIEDFEIRRKYEQIQSDIFYTIYPNKIPLANDSAEEKYLETEKLKNAIIRLYRFNLLVAIGLESKSIINPETVSDFVYNSKITELNIELIKELTEIHERLINLSNTYESTFKPFNIYLNYKKLEDWRFMLLERVWIPNTPDALVLLKRFIILEEQISRSSQNSYRRISNYSLSPQLSSGESSFMNFFSRLHDVLLRYRQGIDNRSNIILFVDEADIGFHPEWSKKFFNWLVTFINDYTVGFTFQIILTTHSPYLLSDLDSSNVILLKKLDDGTASIVPSDMFKTFGANIHDLLATSFFMKEGFMGEFAKSKIEELIEYLARRNNLFTETSSAQLISLIGDEIISSRLKDLHNERFTVLQKLDKNEYEAWLKQELERINL